MILRHNNCRGIKLFRIGRFQMELWMAPKGERIESHIHKHIDSHILFLWGRMNGVIGSRSGSLGFHDCFRLFHIPAGVTHSATILSRWCIFTNLEVWNKGSSISSAAVDFERV